MTTPIRIVLAEDHTIVRQGLRALLSGRPDFEGVGEAADGVEAVALVARIQPEVVVLDLAMPGLNGVDAAREMARLSPKTRVLVLSMHAGEEYVRPALRAGVAGYVLKGSGLGDLVSAIRAVAQGDAFFSPAVARLLLRDVQGPELSAREREVLRLVAEGRSSREVADLLGLSVKTVEGHRTRIMSKLDIHEVAGLVRYAVRAGLVSPED